MTTDETILWPAMRTRVYPARQYENPWFRQGRQAREQRAFLQSIAPQADRQEEDEDYDTWAPPRPTRHFTERKDHILDWEPDLDAEEQEWRRVQAEQLRKEQRRKELHEHARRRAWLALPWEFTVEDFTVFDQADALDQRISRRGGHWFYTWGSWFTLGERPIRTHLVAWYLQYGEITSSTVLRRTCDQKDCISPHHHEELHGCQ